MAGDGVESVLQLLEEGVLLNICCGFSGDVHLHNGGLNVCRVESSGDDAVTDGLPSNHGHSSPLAEDKSNVALVFVFVTRVHSHLAVADHAVTTGPTHFTYAQDVQHVVVELPQ